MWLFDRFLIAATLCIYFASAEYLETVAQWSLLDFAFPSPDPGFASRYRPENTVPTGFEVSWDRVFMTAPRLRSGVPATLYYMNRVELGGRPILKPYPSWDWHSAGLGNFNCSQIISVYRIRLDSCDRLWVLDSGINTSIEDFTVACPPKMLIFDLQTNRLVRRYIFPKDVRRTNNLFTNFKIDETNSRTCDEAFAYITDTAGIGIITYDAGNERSWRNVHATMLPHPDYTNYQIGQESFELFDGIIGLALSEKTGTVYYQPLATDRMFSVPTSALRKGPLQPGESLPVTVVGRKSSQGLAVEIEENSNAILFSPLTETAIAFWQPETNNQRILAYSPEMLQFVAEIRWVARDQGHIWALSTRFHKFFLNTINDREVNIRLLRIRKFTPASTPYIPPYALNPQIQYSYHNNTLYG